jgi:hypothetical protein
MTTTGGRPDTYDVEPMNPDVLVHPEGIDYQRPGYGLVQNTVRREFHAVQPEVCVAYNSAYTSPAHPLPADKPQEFDIVIPALRGFLLDTEHSSLWFKAKLECEVDWKTAQAFELATSYMPWYVQTYPDTTASWFEVVQIWNGQNIPIERIERYDMLHRWNYVTNDDVRYTTAEEGRTDGETRYHMREMAGDETGTTDAFNVQTSTIADYKLAMGRQKLNTYETGLMWNHKWIPLQFMQGIRIRFRLRADLNQMFWNLSNTHEPKAGPGLVADPEANKLAGMHPIRLTLSEIRYRGELVTLLPEAMNLMAEQFKNSGLLYSIRTWEHQLVPITHVGAMDVPINQCRNNITRIINMAQPEEAVAAQYLAQGGWTLSAYHPHMEDYTGTWVACSRQWQFEHNGTLYPELPVDCEHLFNDTLFHGTRALKDACPFETEGLSKSMAMMSSRPWSGTGPGDYTKLPSPCSNRPHMESSWAYTGACYLQEVGPAEAPGGDEIIPLSATISTIYWLNFRNHAVPDSCNITSHRASALTKVLKPQKWPEYWFPGSSFVVKDLSVAIETSGWLGHEPQMVNNISFGAAPHSYNWLEMWNHYITVVFPKTQCIDGADLPVPGVYEAPKTFYIESASPMVNHQAYYNKMKHVIAYNFERQRDTSFAGLNTKTPGTTPILLHLQIAGGNAPVPIITSGTVNWMTGSSVVPITDRFTIGYKRVQLHTYRI